MSAAVEDLFDLVDGLKQRRRLRMPQAPRPQVLTAPFNPNTGTGLGSVDGRAISPPRLNPVPPPAATSDPGANVVIDVPRLRPPVESHKGDVEMSAALPSRDYIPAPLPDDTPRAIKRPVRQKSGDDLADTRQYLSDLQSYKPENHNSRGASIGLGGWRGLQRGGIVGGLMGLVSHAIDPSEDERFHNEREIGRTTGELGQRLGLRRADLEMQGMEAEAELRRANAVKALQPPKPDYQRVEGDDGYYQYDPMNPTAPALKLPIPAKQKTQPERNAQIVTRTNPDGSEDVLYIERDPTTGKPIAMPVPAGTGGTLKNAPKPDNLTAWQREQLRRDQEREARGDAKDKKRELRDQQRDVESTDRFYRERASKAAELYSDYQRWLNEAKGGKSPDKAKYGDDDAYRRMAQAEMRSVFDKLKAYDDVISVSEKVSGWPYAAPRDVKRVSDVMRLRNVDADRAVQMILEAGYVPVR